MKNLTLVLLLASLAFNAALAALYLRGRTAPDRADPSETSPARHPVSAPGPTLDAETWSRLHSEQLPDLVARLREAGFPPDAVRAVLQMELGRAYLARFKALEAADATRPFWQDRPPDPKLEQDIIRLSREQQKALRELLGPDADADDPMRFAFRGRRFDGLPPDKVDALKQLSRDFEERRQDHYATSGGALVDREKIAALERAERDAIARLLSPAELTEYDLRNSNTARTLRNDLVAFNPTEAEFRALFGLRQPFDEQFSTSGMIGQLSADQMRQRGEAQKLLVDQIKAALGPERSADYERATDYNYRQTSQLVARLELPPETTLGVYNVQKDIVARAQRLYADRALPNDQRNQQLAALQQEALAKVMPLLGGTRGLEAYKQYGGQWLQQLVPRIAPPVSAPAVPLPSGPRG